jgi:hypothetical protein
MQDRIVRAILAAFVVLVQVSRLSLGSESVPGAPGAVAAAGSIPAPAAQDAALAHVTYVTSQSVYLDAGSDEGLLAGDIVELLRGETAVATLKVTEVSSDRAICQRPGTGVPVAVGDIVRFEASGPVKPAATAPPAAAPAVLAAGGGSGPSYTEKEEDSSLLRRWGISGRIGLRYLLVNNRAQDGFDFSQPGLDLRFDAARIGAAPVDASVDVRAYRSYRTLDEGESENETLSRVYRAYVGWRPGNSGLRVALGRQFAPAMSAINLFDGMLVDYTHGRWGAGAVAGTQPDPSDFGFSTDIKNYGGYFEYRSAVGSARRWGISTGLVASYDHGEVNRQFLSLQGRYDTAKLSAFLEQEVDFNTGWKKDAGEGSVTNTSTFLSARWRATEDLTVYGGYDNRRDVLLYRDQITPETEFDDQYRQGYWAGVDYSFLKRYWAGLDGRVSSGGDAGTADSYTLAFGARDISPIRLDLRARASRYTNDRLEGWFYSASAGVPLRDIANLSVTVGRRAETPLAWNELEDDLTWYGLEFDMILARQWLLLLSAERNQGDFEKNDQAWASVSYRF